MLTKATNGCLISIASQRSRHVQENKRTRALVFLCRQQTLLYFYELQLIEKFVQIIRILSVVQHANRKQSKKLHFNGTFVLYFSFLSFHSNRFFFSFLFIHFRSTAKKQERFQAMLCGDMLHLVTTLFNITKRIKTHTHTYISIQ